MYTATTGLGLFTATHCNPLDFLNCVPEERHIILDQPALGLKNVASNKGDQGKRPESAVSAWQHGALARQTYVVICQYASVVSGASWAKLDAHSPSGKSSGAGEAAVSSASPCGVSDLARNGSPAGCCGVGVVGEVRVEDMLIWARGWSGIFLRRVFHEFMGRGKFI